MTSRSVAASLSVGSLQKIVVTSITRLAHVFVQLDTDEAYSLAQLSNNIQADTAASAPPLTSHWSRGDDCVALYGATNEWYRARVTAAQRNSVDVFFFDYGNSDTVTNDKVRPLKPQFSKLPAQAVECVLEGVQAVGGQLDDQGFRAMGEALLDKEFTAKIIGKDDVVTIQLVDDSGDQLRDFEDLVKRGILCRHVAAGDLKEGTTYNVYVACVADPHEFWIQLDCNTEKLENLMQRVEELYSRPGHLTVPACPGSLCCAQYSQDSAWYRAEVIQVQGTRARVRFIDYGNSEVIDVTGLKQLDQSVGGEPLAICCALVGAEPVEGDQWSHDAVTAFSTLVLDKPLKCTIEKVALGKPVNVMLVDSSTNLSIVDELLLKHLIRAVAPAKPAQYSLLNFTSNQREEMFITSVDSPSRFWCQLARNGNEIESLMASIADYYSTAKQERLSFIQPGTPCCGQFTEDDTWYRAVVLATEPGNKVRVWYVDYGNQETLPLRRVVALNKKFLQVSVQAVSCGLDGIQPASGSKWSPEASSKLEELAATGSVTVLVKAVKEESGDGWPTKHMVVDIWLTQQGSKLSVADELVKAGLAVREGQHRASQTQILHTAQATLTEMAMTEVLVTFANDPGEFWCQTFTGGAEVGNVMDSLRIHCESPGTRPLGQVQPGMICGAKYSADSEWYRARVEKTAGHGRVTVYFIDYGNCEEVAATDLKELNTQLVHLNAQAIKCRLKDICPVSGSSWSDASVAAFQVLVSDKGLFACALNQTGDGVFEIKLFDTNSSEDVEIGEELVRMGMAQGSVGQQATQPTGMEKYEALSITSGQSLTVIVTDAENLSSFWCQLIDEKPQADLGKVMSDMAVYYNNPESRQDVLRCPEVGMPCAAQFTEDDNWYRAVVTVVKGSMFEVQYVDYGNIETLQQDRLRVLKSSFTALPPISFSCELYGVMPTGSGWTEKARSEFEALGKDKILTANVKSVDPQGRVTVELLNGSVSLADRLVSASCATREVGRQRTAPTSVRQEQHAPAMARQQAAPYKYSFPSLAVGQTEKMVVSYVTSPSEIWCQSPGGQDLLENMQEALQLVYGKLTPGKGELDNMAPDIACVAKSPSDGVWYRAVITQVLGKGGIEVHYVDYGNLEVVQQNEVKSLHRDFKAVPAQAIRCGLYQCHEPADGWKDSHRDTLDSLVADVELTGEVKSAQSNPTQIIVDMTFVKEGLKVNLRDEFLSTVRGNGRSTVQSHPPVQQLTTVKSPLRMEVSPSKGERVSPTLLGQVQMVKIDLTPPNLQIESFEDICIVGVKTVDQMWCQLIKTARQMNQLSASIGSYIETGPQPLIKPNIGQFCLAQYVDGAYYRGHIKNIHPDGKVEVFFIDYGNVEKVESSALKEISSDHCKLPAQAFTCRLAGVKPIQPGRWSQEASAFLEQRTIGRQLVARRVQAPDVAIELFDTSDPKTDLKLGDELVRAGLAIADTVGVRETVKAVINPTHMLPGKEYDVIVTHVTSPVRFYCQVQNLADEFAVLTDELYTYCSNLSLGQGGPGPLESSVGQFVAANYSVDGGWYRAKMTSITDRQAQTVCVFFVDYGNEETVNWSSVKYLPQNFTKLYALCFEASLDVSPSDISSDDTQRFRTAVSDLEFSCRVLSSDGDGHNTVQLLRKDKRTNVADELGFKPKIAPPRAPPGRSLDYTHPRLVQGSTIKVFGTVCEEPGRFWCQLTDSVGQLETLMAEIEDHYGVLSPSDQTFTTATARLACCAKFSQDQAWYRARIRELSGSEVTVHYVDYGNSEGLPLSQLKSLSSKFIELPAQAVLCHLTDVCSSKDCSAESVVEYEKLIQEQELEVVVKSVVGPGEVEVDIPTLREQLQDLGMIKATKTAPVAVVDPSFRVSHVQVPSGSQQEVYVSHVDSHKCVWCQLVSQTEQVESLSQEVQESYSKPEVVLSLGNLMNIKPESVCCAKYSVDGNWYRAVVTETTDKDVTLCFIDYGNTSTVQSSNLKPLLKQFSILPAQSFPCCVSGLSSSQCDELRQLAQEKSFLCSVTGLDRQLVVVDLCIKNDLGKDVNILEVLTPPEVKDGEEIKFKQMQVTKSSVEKVYVSNVVSPNHFYCQLVSSEDQLTALMDQVAQYSSNADVSNIESRAVGIPCVAKYSQDEQYYRAEIERVGDQSCDVVFIDYGNSDTVKCTDIREISAELCQLPAFCIQCHLAATEGCTWETKSTDRFIELTEAEAVTCHFVKEVKGVWDVDIETTSGSVKSALCALPSAPSFTTEKTSIPQVKMTTDVVVDAFISSAIDPETFYIQLQSESEVLQCLVEKLAESYVSLAEDDFVVPSPVEGMVCCAQFSADQQWYRALVVKVAGIDCEVLFVDYGNRETVPLSRVKELKTDLVALPAQAVLCSLVGVKPSGKGWSEEAVRMLDEVMNETQLKVHVVGKSGEKYLTNVVIAETDESLADRLISAGHAVAEVRAPAAELVSAEVSEVLSAVTAATESENCSIATPEEVAPDLFISLQLAVGDQLDAKVVHVKSPDVFFCQPVTSADELEKLAEKLAEICAESESASRRLPKEQLFRNTICAAKYAEHGVWYRTKITSVSENSDTVSVLFVDYGNTETVANDQLLLLEPELQALPAQALCCCLANILPANVDEGWSDDAQTTFMELVGDFIFSCEVVSVQPEGLHEVRLTNIETGESLEELLIARGVAINERTELETGNVLQWQTGTALSEQAAEGGISGDVPYVEVDRSLGKMESEEVRYEIQPDITRDVTERGIEDGAQFERSASPAQPDLVTNQVDDYSVEPPTVQPDVLVAQVDLIAKPLAEPEIPPEEPDIQKSVRLSQQEEATALPQVTMSNLHVTDSTTGQSVDTEVTPSIETIPEDKTLAGDKTVARDKILAEDETVAQDETVAEDETVEADLIISDEVEGSWRVVNEAMEASEPFVPAHTIKALSSPEVAKSSPETKPDGEVEALGVEPEPTQPDDVEVSNVDVAESVRSFQEPTEPDELEVPMEEANTVEPLPESTQPDDVEDSKVEAIETVESFAEPIKNVETPMEEADAVESLPESTQPDDEVDESRVEVNQTVESFAEPIEKVETFPEASEPDVRVESSMVDEAEAKGSTKPDSLEISSIEATETGESVTEYMKPGVSRIELDDTVESLQDCTKPDSGVVGVDSKIVVAETAQSIDRQETDEERTVANELVELVLQTAVNEIESQSGNEAQQTAAMILEQVVDRVVSEVAQDSGGSQSSEEKAIDEDLQQVVITYVEDDGRFWARIGNDEDHREYAELTEKMNDHYGPLEVPEDQEAVADDEELPIRSSPGKYSLNDVCAVPCLEDGQWYRGRVIGLISDASEGDSAFLRLVDSGQAETVAFSLLRPLVPPFGKAPEFATCCSLAGIEPGSDGWSNEVKTFLGDLSAGKVIYAQVESSEDSETTQLHLFAPSEELHGASFQIYSSQLPFIAKSDSSKPPSEVDSLRVEIGSSFAISERGSSPPLHTLSEDKEPSIPVEDTDGPNMADNSSIVPYSRVSEIVHKPHGYVYVNKLMVDQGLAKFIA